jgi:DNA-binding HxlR family transcriptional regulator
MEACCPQPIECAAEFVSKKWTLSIIVAVGKNKRMRFNQIKEHLQTVSQKVLSQRLAELEERGILLRTVLSGKPPGVSYELTKQGKTLYKATIALAEWCDLSKSSK